MLPIKPSNVNSSHVKALSATLIWKQVYNCDEEKATKYHVKVANKPELSRLINHSFGNTSPSMCEHVLTGLQPGQTYHVVIIAGNESGTVFSDDISVQTLSKSVYIIFSMRWNIIRQQSHNYYGMKLLWHQIMYESVITISVIIT